MVGGTGALAMFEVLLAALWSDAAPPLEISAGTVTQNLDWGGKLQLAGPMNTTWLAFTTQRYVVGDHISTPLPIVNWSGLSRMHRPGIQERESWSTLSREARTSSCE